MEQNREPINKPTFLGKLTSDKEAKNILRGRAVFSVNGMGETGQPHAKA